MAKHASVDWCLAAGKKKNPSVSPTVSAGCADSVYHIKGMDAPYMMLANVANNSYGVPATSGSD